MPAQRLTGVNLEQLNTLSVADAIRHFSGVQLKDYGGVGGLKTVNVRSLGSAHTAVFYDGIQLTNAQNGQIDLSKFSMDNIDEILLYNGQKSSIFQPARGFFAANSIYLNTKQPQFESKPFKAKASIKTGSFGLFNPTVQWQQKINQNTALTAHAEWNKAHGKYKYNYTNGIYDTTAERQNGDIAALRLELSIYGKGSQKKPGIEATKWQVKGYMYQSERGLPGAIVANRFKHGQRQWDKNWFVQGSYQNQISEKYRLMLNAKINQDNLRYVDPEYQTVNGALDNLFIQKEYYLSAVNLLQLNHWWDVSLAADQSISTLDANSILFPYPTRYTSLAALSTHLHFNLVEFQASLLANCIKDHTKTNGNGSIQKNLSPIISVSFQPFAEKWIRLRSFYKKSFRMPSFNDQYYSFVGSSNLLPELAEQYNLGATWVLIPSSNVLDQLSIQTDLYYNNIKNKIVAIPSANLFKWSMVNLGRVKIKGLETNISADLKLDRQLLLKLGANYTYQNALDVTPQGSTYGHQIPYTPQHSGTAHTGISWSKLQINYSFIYTGHRYSQKENSPLNLVQPWYTSDFNVTWQQLISQKKIKLTAELNNAFNQYYDVILNFPMPGRSYHLSLSVQL